MTTTSSMKLYPTVLFLAFFGGCAAQQPQRKVDPYEPNFSYSPVGSDKKITMAVGVIDPQFGDSAALMKQARNDDEPSASCVRLRCRR